MMRLIYMAHPVSGDVPGNLLKASEWLRYLQRENPEDAIIAPWIFELSHFDDGNAAQRERGLHRCEVTAGRCDLLWCVGIKSALELTDGMLREAKSIAFARFGTTGTLYGALTLAYEWKGYLCPR